MLTLRCRSSALWRWTFRHRQLKHSPTTARRVISHSIEPLNRLATFRPPLATPPCCLKMETQVLTAVASGLQSSTRAFPKHTTRYPDALFTTRISLAKVAPMILMVTELLSRPWPPAKTPITTAVIAVSLLLPSWSIYVFLTRREEERSLPSSTLSMW